MPTLEDQKHHLRGLKAPGNGPLLRAEQSVTDYDKGVSDGVQEVNRYLEETVERFKSELDELFTRTHKHATRIRLIKKALDVTVVAVEKRIYD